MYIISSSRQKLTKASKANKGVISQQALIERLNVNFILKLHHVTIALLRNKISINITKLGKLCYWYVSSVEYISTKRIQMKHIYVKI